MRRNSKRFSFKEMDGSIEPMGRSRSHGKHNTRYLCVEQDIGTERWPSTEDKRRWMRKRERERERERRIHKAARMRWERDGVRITARNATCPVDARTSFVQFRRSEAGFRRGRYEALFSFGVGIFLIAWVSAIIIRYRRNYLYSLYTRFLFLSLSLSLSLVFLRSLS